LPQFRYGDKNNIYGEVLDKFDSCHIEQMLQIGVIAILILIISVCLMTPLSPEATQSSAEGFIDNLGLTGTLHTAPITTTGSVVPRGVDMKVAWNPLPAQMLAPLIQQFGYPDLVDVNGEGLALWKRNTLQQRGFCWREVILHDRPAYPLRLVYYLPLDGSSSLGERRLTTEQKQILRENLADFSPALQYDSLNSTLSAAGNKMDECLAVLVLAKRLIRGEINLQQAQNLILSTIASTDRFSPSYDLYASDKFKIELCTVNIPKANALGEVPTDEIWNLRPGGTLRAWTGLPGEKTKPTITFK